MVEEYKIIREDDYFAWNIRLLIYSGVWPREKRMKILTQIVVIVLNFWFVWSVFVYTPTELMAINETVKDLSDLIKHLNMAITHLLGIFKAFVWIYNRKKILYIMETLRTLTTGIEKTEDFDPEDITTKDRHFKDFCTKFFFVVGNFVALSSCIQSYVTLFTDYESQYDYVVDHHNVTNAIYNQKLSYFSWIPWKFRDSRVNFGWAILFQFIPVLNFAYVIVALDTLYASIISSIGCQLEIIKGAYRTIRVRCLRRLKMTEESDSEELNLELTKEINRVTAILQRAFELAASMEALFSLVILVQVLVSLLVFCTCLYLVSSLPATSQKFLVEFIYLFAVEMQLMFYCYFGDRLTTSAEGIPFAIYEGDWLAASQTFKKTMLITMTRMIKPLHMTMGKFAPLTLAAFVTIGRGSYSFFAFLKQSQ